MNKIFQKVWNYDFEKFTISKSLWIVITLIIGLLSGIFALKDEILFNFFGDFEIFFIQNPHLVHLKYLTIIISAFLVLYVTAILIFHEKAASKEIGRKRLYQIYLPHFITAVIDTFVLVSALVLIGFIYQQVTGDKINMLLMASIDGEFHPMQAIIDFYDKHVPTIIQMPYLLALILTFVLSDLPVYVCHYMSHWSRFLWFVGHRSHHTAEYLQHGGQGPVFSFSFLFMIFPLFFTKLAISKFLYTEPLIREVIIFHILYLMTEKFNHSSAFYQFAYKNKFIYTMFSFFGNGPYHITHHSAKEGEDIVNIANLGFNFWDRIFGTFKKPSKEHPPVGLTNQPKIKLNPLRLYLSGWFTIFYELKHNPPKYWFKIIFGSVYYSPPKTKDYLIEYYPSTVAHLPSKKTS